MDAGEISACLLALLAQRDPGASICPSDVARALGDADTWRALMDPVRAQAQALARTGKVVITQGSRQLPAEGPFHGPIRLRRGPNFSS
ncbi:DUF3253 domain-containing protein [Pseudomonas sp. RIT-PI-S]|uniref:DUF3253 domain-containing protein n=1 Tax=Pseudomonas sp. RIT-PI-S TaxID=3035295 RepID=UPI0021DAA38B|nr:DUF3253 domain-containing protein [Pseudomonas sp. RIT-PI-S]